MAGSTIAAHDRHVDIGASIPLSKPDSQAMRFCFTSECQDKYDRRPTYQARASTRLGMAGHRLDHRCVLCAAGPRRRRIQAS